MKNLVIVESPSKSKTIEKYLGKDFKVISSKGHIRDLATRGKEGLGVDVDNNFEAMYIVSNDKKDVIKQLQNEAKKADNIYLATDPDREGEAISWHLAQVLDLDINLNNRVVFNEITKNAVTKAFSSPRMIDMNLVHSQETRRILDRIIGFKLSKLLQSKIKSKSAGRVQSVALRMIVEKEREILKFKPEEYWSIEACISKPKKFKVELVKYKNKKIKIDNEVEKDKILQDLTGKLLINKVDIKTKHKSPKLAFNTSSLQQEAANKLNFNAKKTMRIAQKLYEGVELSTGLEGLITYMRSDSTRLSDDFVKSTLGYIHDNFGKEYVGKYKFSLKENSQDAHEGIRVTNINYRPEDIEKYLSNDEFKLYSLIYFRTLASLMKDADVENISVSFSDNDYLFTTTGNRITFDGYLKVYSKYESTKDMILPKLKEGEILDVDKYDCLQHFTQPPLRFNEARLIKEMEENGIGRPSTYATIIETILFRNYVVYEAATKGGSKVFIPTEQGILTSDKLTENFNSIINVEYTAHMETELDQISEGSLDYVNSLREFYADFSKLVDKAYTNMEKIAPTYTGELCPECNSQLVIRNGRFGQFIACENYPSCKFHKPLVVKEKKEAELTGELCPECNLPLVYRISKYKTKFIACSGFPKCRFVKKIPKEENENAG